MGALVRGKVHSAGKWVRKTAHRTATAVFLSVAVRRAQSMVMLVGVVQEWQLKVD